MIPYIIIIVLIIVAFVLTMLLSKAKQEYKRDAYSLLKKQNPSQEEIKATIKALNRYIGVLSKDEEASQLINRLMNRLTEISS